MDIIPRVLVEKEKNRYYFSENYQKNYSTLSIILYS